LEERVDVYLLDGDLLLPRVEFCVAYTRWRPTATIELKGHESINVREIVALQGEVIPGWTEVVGDRKL
jgi:hypothetical protein